MLYLLDIYDNILQLKQHIMNYIILRDYVDYTQMLLLKETFYNNTTEAKSLNLLDGDDMSNIIYKSKRSKGLSYMYSDESHVMDINKEICEQLNDATGLEFGNSINNIALPMCHYSDGGVILAHRGVKKDSNLTTYQGYVAVLMLTQRGKDFEDGRFYLNEKATCSVDGKTVTNDLLEDRYYPELNEGDIILFDNTHYIHGVEETKVTPLQIGRLTCSFRTN